jgi:hypothetical protein
MKNTLLILLLTFFFSCGYSQNVKTSNIKWTSISTFNINEGDVRSDTTVLTSYSSNRLEWADPEGNLMHSFQVVEVIGDWSNASANGSIQYEIKEGTGTGTITIRKTAEGTKVIFVMISTSSQGPVSDPPQTTELTIQNFKVI